MSKKQGYQPPEGYDPETVTPEMRAIVESLQRAAAEFEDADKPLSLEERLRRVRASVPGIYDYLDPDAVKKYLKNVGESGVEAAISLPVGGPKTMGIGFVVGALAGAAGVKAETIREKRGLVIGAGKRAFGKAARWASIKVSKGREETQAPQEESKPDEPEI